MLLKKSKTCKAANTNVILIILMWFEKIYLKSCVSYTLDSMSSQQFSISAI